MEARKQTRYIVKTTIQTLLGDDHAELDRLLDGAIGSFRIDDVASVYHRLDVFWARLAVHIRAEHLQLFPALLSIAETRTDLRATVEKLRADHDFFMRELTWAIKTMRLAIENRETETPAGLVSRMDGLKKRLDEHNTIEEAEIYMLADAVLPAQVLEKLVRSATAELENRPPRFGSGE